MKIVLKSAKKLYNYLEKLFTKVIKNAKLGDLALKYSD
jgi:hypothetical protein